MAHGAPAAGARAFRGHHALQRALRVLRLLEDAGRRREADELKSFADAARFFNPMLVTFTGGEPTLRRDLEELVAAVDARGAAQVHHAASPTAACSPPSARTSLWDAGINQFNISLDYLDGRHDAARGIPGLTAQDLRDVDGDARARHRQHPLQHRHQGRQPRSAHADRRARAQELGCGVNFSVYTDAKNGNRDAPDRRAQQRASSSDVIAELLAFKRRRAA